MDLLFAILWPLLLAALITAAFGVAVFLFRKAIIKSEVQMIAFLAKRFDFIQKGSADYIDETLIRKWGNTGWSFIGLGAIVLNFSINDFLSLGSLSALGVLFFGGLFLGDSRAAVYFLRRLGSSKYRKDSGLACM